MDLWTFITVAIVHWGIRFVSIIITIIIKRLFVLVLKQLNVCGLCIDSVVIGMPDLLVMRLVILDNELVVLICVLCRAELRLGNCVFVSAVAGRYQVMD